MYCLILAIFLAALLPNDAARITWEAPPETSVVCLSKQKTTFTHLGCWNSTPGRHTLVLDGGDSAYNASLGEVYTMQFYAEDRGGALVLLGSDSAPIVKRWVWMPVVGRG